MSSDMKVPNSPKPFGVTAVHKSMANTAPESNSNLQTLWNLSREEQEKAIKQMDFSTLLQLVSELRSSEKASKYENQCCMEEHKEIGRRDATIIKELDERYSLTTCEKLDLKAA